MSEYRKKPVVVEAVPCREIVRMSRLDWEALPDWVVAAYDNGDIIFLHDGVTIQTLEGRMEARLGDWIIRGVKGEIYPCKPDIFDATYEEVEAP